MSHRSHPVPLAQAVVALFVLMVMAAPAEAGNAYVRARAAEDPRVGVTMDVGQGAPRHADLLQAGGLRLAFSTFLGDYEPPARSGGNQGNAIAVDADGYIYVAGSTGDSGIFLKHPLRSQKSRGFDDAFVIKLNPSGTDVVFGTLLGGERGDHATGIGVDRDHNVYVVGYTYSADFPTTDGHKDSCGAGADAFAADAFATKLSANGDRLVYSRCLGGALDDVAAAVAVDPDGSVYLGGTTRSEDFPTRRAFQARNGGVGEDGFVAKLDLGGDIVYSTYLGGAETDWVSDIALADDQKLVVVGSTESSDFPTRAALQPTIGGGSETHGEDAFVARLAPSGDSVDFSTYLGGAEDNDQARGVVIDRDGRVVIVGYTASGDFPTRGAAQGAMRGSCDAFVARLVRDGLQLDRATYLGGGGDGTEVAFDVAVASDGGVVVLGVTHEADFPVVDAMQATLGGEGDLFITKYLGSMSDLVFSTYLGGSDSEMVFVGDQDLGGTATRPGIAVDSSGALVLTAGTFSADFPLKAAIGKRHPGDGDVGAVVVKFGDGVPAPPLSGPAACSALMGRVPSSVVAAALADPTTVIGWGELCNPNLPRSRYNTLRTWLTLLNLGRAYHPFYNPVVFRCGCP